jgi:hypothetical protein
MVLVMVAGQRGAAFVLMSGVHRELEEMASLFATAMIQMRLAPFMLEPGLGID